MKSDHRSKFSNLREGLVCLLTFFHEKKKLFDSVAFDFQERLRDRKTGFSDAASLLCPFVLIASPIGGKDENKDGVQLAALAEALYSFDTSYDNSNHKKNY